MPTDIYLNLSRQLEYFMMINSRGLARTQNKSTKNTSNLHGLVRTQNTSAQKMSNPQGYSMEKSE